VNPLVRVIGLSVCFSWAGVQRQVLKDLDLSLDPGDWLTITGASGSGKSTFLRSILGLQDYQQGEVWVRDQPMLPGQPRTEADLDLKYLPQNPADLFLGETVEEELAAIKDGATRMNLARRYSLESHLSREIRHLSGGERQRLALASFFGASSSMLLLDEPSSYLDAETAALLKESLQEAHARGAAILHITQFDHERTWGGRSLELKQGQFHVTNP